MNYEMLKIDRNDIEKLKCCPWCNSAKINKYKSFTVLELSKCKVCNLVFTSTRVKEKSISSYYGLEYCNLWSKASTDFQYTEYFKKQLSIIKLLTKGRNLLDIGCGGGTYSYLAKQMDFNVEAQDIVQENINNIYNKFNIKGYCGKIEDLHLKSNKFDVLVMIHVIEHVYNISKFLDECSRLLTKDGIMVILIPNLFTIDCTFQPKLYKKILSLPFHNYHFNRKTFLNIMKNKNFQLILEKHNLSIYLSKLIYSPKYIFNKLNRIKPKNKNQIKKEITLSDFKKPIISSFLSKYYTGEQFAFYLKKVN